jgi:hypothetical protein
MGVSGPTFLIDSAAGSLRGAVGRLSTKTANGATIAMEAAGEITMRFPLAEFEE